MSHFKVVLSNRLLWSSRLSLPGDNQLFEGEPGETGDEQTSDSSAASKRQSGVNVGRLILIVCVVLAFIAVCAIGLINFLEPPQDKSVQASYKSLAKQPTTSSPFPEQLTASFRRLSDRWGANGPATDSDLIKLCREQEVDSLQLEYTDITSVGLDALAKEPTTRLIIAGQNIEIPEARAISKLKGLTRLDIANCKNTDDEVIAALGDLPNLKMLTVRHCGITDNGIATITKNFRALGSLDVMGNKVTDRCIDSIKSLPALDFLSINCTKITNDGVKNLMTPDFKGGFHGADLGIKDDAVERISKCHCWNVNLSGNPITDKSLRMLAGVKGLQRLSVTNCPLLTNEGISYFKEKRPDCKLDLDKGYYKRADKDQSDIKDQP